MGAIRLVIWNVRGMNSPVKRGKVYAHLKSLKADICFLQETHIIKSSAGVLCPPWASQIFQFNYTVKPRGVAIFINTKVSFIHEQTFSDHSGQYSIVKGLLNEI